MALLISSKYARRWRFHHHREKRVELRAKRLMTGMRGNCHDRESFHRFLKTQLQSRALVHLVENELILAFQCKVNSRA
jgi:hypothetical protein